MFWRIVLLFSCFKLLLIPSYRSTDFEVHRNWLAITHSLPINQWYTDSTSEWTLDYPPFFAWFEFILSQVAKYFDKEMLIVDNLNYASLKTILFQRLSVIVSDLVLALGTKECCTYLSSCGIRKSSKWSSRWGSPTAILKFLLLGNAGLLLIDHIHFQYNGLLFGILLLSITKTMQDNYLLGAFWFSVLLNMKHIYVYVAPAYFIYYLRNYCLRKTVNEDRCNISSFSVVNLAKLGAIVLGVFAFSFGPFIVYGQLAQVLSRLFPFKRGLCHAYWAPNFWALYNAADKVLIKLAKLSGFKIEVPVASMTGGLVQEFEHAVLPTVTPTITFILTFITIMPCLIKLWNSPENPLHFMRSIIICASCAFMFGWHVHEKAIIMVILPLSVMAVVWKKEAEIFLLMSTIGHYSLFPLFFKPAVQIIKVLYFLLYSVYAFTNLSQMYDITRHGYCLPLLSKKESWFIMFSGALYFLETILFPITGVAMVYPFLPLMITSVYCSIGISYCWLKYYVYFINLNKQDHKRKAY